MHQLENTLYIMTQGTYLHLDHDTLLVKLQDHERNIPLHHVGGIFCFGNVALSPFLIHRCASEGRQIVWFDKGGRFKARLSGPTKGNVLLRKEQLVAAMDERRSLGIARNIIAGKVKNSRQVILRAKRDSQNEGEQGELERVERQLAHRLERVRKCSDMDVLRGLEGEAARLYYGVFGLMIKSRERECFDMKGRSRRPPRDPVNALLSFLYTILMNDIIGAIEGVGLDPQIGFLHAIRPGRPALALDLMEELRPIFADRLALTLINRRQLTIKHFEEKPGGASLLTEDGRRNLLIAYQERKQDEMNHPIAKRKMPVALIPHMQARIMARHLRGEVAEYIPFLYR